MASLPGFFSLGPSFLSLTFSLSPEKWCFCGCGSAMNLINEQVSIAMWCHCRMVIGRFTLEAAPKRGFPCYPRSEFWPMFTYITMVYIYNIILYYIIHIHTSAAVKSIPKLKGSLPRPTRWGSLTGPRLLWKLAQHAETNIKHLNKLIW